MNREAKITGIGVWVAAVSLLGAAPVSAQEAEEPEELKPWSNEAQLSLADSAGNASSRTFAISDRFTYNWTYAELVVSFELFRQSSEQRVLVNEIDGVREELIDQVSAERYEAEGKYRQNVLDELFWFVQGGWYQNRPAGVDQRLGAHAGVGYRFLENTTTLVAGEIGPGVVREELVDAGADTFADARAFLELRHEFNDNASLDSQVEVRDNIQDTDDLRITAGVAVTSQMNDTFALRVGWDLRYDRQPPVIVVDSNPDAPPGAFVFDTTDRTLTASLVVSF